MICKEKGHPTLLIFDEWGELQLDSTLIWCCAGLDFRCWDDRGPLVQENLHSSLEHVALPSQVEAAVGAMLGWWLVDTWCQSPGSWGTPMDCTGRITQPEWREWMVWPSGPHCPIFPLGHSPSWQIPAFLLPSCWIFSVWIRLKLHNTVLHPFIGNGNFCNEWETIFLSYTSWLAFLSSCSGFFLACQTCQFSIFPLSGRYCGSSMLK